MALANLHRFFRIAGLQHGVTLGFQVHSAYVAKDGFILHQENCLSPRGWHLDWLEALVGIRSSVDTGEINRKNAAFARFTVNPDESVALLHNSVDRRQTQPRSFSGLFGRIERFENMNLSLGVHADACIADPQQDVLPWWDRDALVV